ncbi:hypothetical protein PENANT_c010G11563 [Penicillium antarcticum]|uniref:HTH psq-type domain-containing protein n=1 Tax=Penicillium antarcticum TaxID=416450 RepID=A0A1V6Q7N9_9EURO|nr:hypothetical protein PENANT_c010G11563 [Penicillium antarcticum]
MPPIRTKSSQKRTEQEGKISLAIQAIQNHEISSITLAAKTFEVPRAQLYGTVLLGFKTARFLAFAAAGLVHYNPDRVISKLNIHLRTPKPPSSRVSEWEPKSLSNYVQLQKQASSIKAMLKQRSKTPPSLLDSAINQLLKACQMMMQSVALLEKEVSDLRAENEKKKQKKTRSMRQIPSEKGLSALEASTLREILAQVSREAGRLRHLYSHLYTSTSAVYCYKGFAIESNVLGLQS